nr:YppF family protein [uncultured Bacillus sp.]
MLIEDLMYGFAIVKKRRSLNLNELLDFTQYSYINGNINIVEYKNLLCELNRLGAKKPESYMYRNSELTSNSGRNNLQQIYSK